MKNYLISEAIGDIAGSAYNRYVWGQSPNMPIYNPFWSLFASSDDEVNEYGTNPKIDYKLQIYNSDKASM